MRILTWLLVCFGVLVWPAHRANAAATQVELLPDHEAARPGDTVLVGVRLTMAPRWHTYWRFGGDVGFPTTITWELPEGITAGEIQWPVPGKYFTNSLTSYEYAKEAVLLVPLKLAANAPAGAHALSANVKWLECETGGSCVPAKATVKTTLTVGASAKPSAAAAQFAAWQKLLPTSQPSQVATALWDSPGGTNNSRTVLIEWSASPPKPDFFPYGGDGFEVAGPTEIVSSSGGKTVLRKQVKKSEGDWPKQLSGLLVERADEPHPTGYEVNLPINESAATAAPVAVKTASNAPAPVAQNEITSFWHALVLAFFGGLILNVMPCVLPVIALKIFGFVNQAKESPARVRMLGVVYCLGVLASFVVLAAVVIAVQQAGKSATWGMQFQNPIFLVCMVTLVTLVALNLFGLFEVSLGGGALTARLDGGGHGGCGQERHVA